jgi:hypothetical protein
MLLYLAQQHSHFAVHGHFDRDDYHALKPDYIQEDWDWRMSTRGLWLAAGFLNALAWLMFTVPLIKLSWILSHGGIQSISIHLAIVILALGGTMTEWLSRFFWAGSFLASTKLLAFNLDNWARVDLQNDMSASSSSSTSDGMGWKTLELNHFVTTGFIWFVDAFEWICLGGIMVCIYTSVRHWRTKDLTCFGGCWNGLSLFIGLMCILEFVSEILQFEGARVFGVVSLIYAAINRLVLIPYWILALGYALDRVTIKEAYGADGTLRSELALTEVRGGGGSQAPVTFTIDDDGDEADAADGDPAAHEDSPTNLSTVPLDRVPPEGSFANFQK